MSDWINVANEGDIADGKWITYTTDDEDILIIYLNGQYYALQDLCTHDGGELNCGELDAEEMICPRHGARFCIKTGQATCPPAYEAINTYPVRIHHHKIQIKISKNR